MRPIKSPNIAQLLMQMHFVPLKKRRKQLAEAEKLLEIIDTNKEYPYEFVYFRITGFMPKESTIKEIIKGSDLADDLRTFIAKLSIQLAEPVITQKEKIYTIAELAKSLSVSTKTINRWRKKGLAAKKYIFEGGIKVLGISQSALDKFLKAEPGISQNQHRFKRLTDDERNLIIKTALRLARNKDLSRYQIINKTVEKTGRSHETIRYTLKKFEKSYPGRFTNQWSIMDSEKTGEIYKEYKDGIRVEELIRKFSRSKSTIYRLLKMRRIRTLFPQKIDYVSSNEFLQPNAREKILTGKIAYQKHPLPEFEKANVEEYTKHLLDAPTLNRQTEMEMFRRYNFLKFLASTKKNQLKPPQISSKQLDIIENYLKEAQLIKKMIIEANIRFVIAIARRHSRDKSMLPELISEGIYSLMRAIEKFDYAKGFRFSTYATWIIAKDFAKIPQYTSAAGGVENIRDDIDQNRRITEAVDSAIIERARQSLVQTIRENLDEREQYIILNHFGLTGSIIRREKKTLQQIGDELNLTKERARQIELAALQKLRQLLSMEEFELLTE